jgi:hypothetical protein
LLLLLLVLAKEVLLLLVLLLLHVRVRGRRLIAEPSVRAVLLRRPGLLLLLALLVSLLLLRLGRVDGRAGDGGGLLRGLAAAAVDLVDHAPDRHEDAGETQPEAQPETNAETHLRRLRRKRDTT